MRMNAPSLMAVAAAMVFLLTTTADAHHNCANLPGMKLTVKELHIDLNDNRPVCVAIPGEFNITIHNPPGSGVSVGSGDVTAKEKDDSADPDVTIRGDNVSPTNMLTVKVDGDAVPGGIYEFWIFVEGVGALDPKVEIVDQDEMKIHIYKAIEATMNFWGLGFEDIGTLRPPPETD